MIQVEWGESGQDDKVLNSADNHGSIFFGCFHCMDEGYMFYTPKIMGPQLKTLKFC